MSIRAEAPKGHRYAWQELADTARAHPMTWYSMPVGQRSTRSDLVRGRIAAFAGDLQTWEVRTATDDTGELRIYVRHWPEGAPA